VQALLEILNPKRKSGKGPEVALSDLAGHVERSSDKDISFEELVTHIHHVYGGGHD